MRKQIIAQASQGPLSPEPDWLHLEHISRVEVSSEEAAHLIESALIPDTGLGWRAAESGEQTIRLLFDVPQRIRRVCLLFDESMGGARTQEFVLSWLPNGEQNYRTVVRQQFNFSPRGATTEVEDYVVELDGVVALKLTIIPDIGGGHACASLAYLRLA